MTITGTMPYLKKLAVPKPRMIQNTMRKGIEPKPDVMPTPRISTAVSARPTMPEYIGVKPSNSMNTSTASGSSRYHFCRIASQGLGKSDLAMPMSPARPASRCTIQNAVA